MLEYMVKQNFLKITDSLDNRRMCILKVGRGYFDLNFLYKF